MLALAVVPWYLTVAGQITPLLLVTGPLSAAMLLIYARQVGLMGWKSCIGPHRGTPRTAKRRKRRIPAAIEADRLRLSP